MMENTHCLHHKIPSNFIWAPRSWEPLIFRENPVSHPIVIRPCQLQDTLSRGLDGVSSSVCPFLASTARDRSSKKEIITKYCLENFYLDFWRFFALKYSKMIWETSWKPKFEAWPPIQGNNEASPPYHEIMNFKKQTSRVKRGRLRYSRGNCGLPAKGYCSGPQRVKSGNFGVAKA